MELFFNLLRDLEDMAYVLFLGQYLWFYEHWGCPEVARGWIYRAGIPSTYSCNDIVLWWRWMMHFFVGMFFSMLSNWIQATKDCVAKTLKRLEEKIHDRVSLWCFLFYVICLINWFVTHIFCLLFFKLWVSLKVP